MSHEQAAARPLVDGAGPPLLELRNVTAGYGEVTVLRDVSISVHASSVVAVLGPNGAGKTTLLRVATGLVKPRTGQVLLSGEDVTSQPPHALARRGLCHIPEGRGVFPSLTVRENLILGAPKAKEQRAEALDRSIDLLPVLGTRLHQTAGSLSGGEQQMLALARAMASHATLVAVDEASLGLAPIVVEHVYDVLRRIVASGAAVILVEQYVHRAIEFSDRVYMLNRGCVGFAGSASDVERDRLFADYLGASAP
jgi:branched-chain amino acid transport system ATP-binding protein